MNPAEQVYHRRIRAWTLYDWANSAFATTILAAVLPVYYSQVAAANLPSPALATAYWSTSLSVSIFLVALVSPVLGTVSDVMRGKKLFLACFAGLGVLATGLLVLVESGDWLLASLLFVLGRIGFAAANVFYDALLPHVAREQDRDRVSTRGFAVGYLGGGLLLAVNVVMIRLLPGTWGPRLSFLSVAVWWALFSIPLLTTVPEPHTLAARRENGASVVAISFRRLWLTLKEIKKYRELFKFLLAYLIYIDGVGTIIGVAAIYGAELGFGSLELILALLLVQFVGIPFSLIFGRLPADPDSPAAGSRFRPRFLAFILLNVLLLPVLGLGGARLLPAAISGAAPEPYLSTAEAAGQGTWPAADSRLRAQGDWRSVAISAALAGKRGARTYLGSDEPGARLDFRFRGQVVEIIHSRGPDHGAWAVEIDGAPLRGPDGAALVLDGYQDSAAYGRRSTFRAPQAGEHVLSLVNRGPNSATGHYFSLAELRVLPPRRASRLPLILASILLLELVSLALAWIIGGALCTRMVRRLDTKRSIMLALWVYAVIAVWGFFLDSVIEFWCLAWLVACVQGGSQALSRSLYAGLVPAAKSGEFFGFFGVMEKFATLFGPLVFAAAAATFGSSRPAVLSVILFFLVGLLLLRRVDVAAGRRSARAEDESLKHQGGLD
jgi:MFS-type transporter involved in bile tolerance (Atg22 family)